jgi:hypothetical protein
VRRSFPLVIAVALACFASTASAQFTAAVVPPKPPPRVDTVARADSVKKAKAALTERLSDMKAWVDSAATALAMAPTPAAESTTHTQPKHATTVERKPTTTETSTGEVVRRAPANTTFRNGAPAPNTATTLPLLAVIGAGALLTGLALIRR